MKIIVIEPTKPPEVREIPDDQEAAYKAMSEIIGGYLECLPFTPTTDAFIDEEAKIRDDKPPVMNGIATRLIRIFLDRLGRTLMPGDYITNTMVIVGNRNPKGEVDGDTYGVPQDVIDEVMNLSRTMVSE